jgi:hypothetical protein
MMRGYIQSLCYKIHCSPAYRNSLSDILVTYSLKRLPHKFMTRWKHPARSGIVELEVACLLVLLGGRGLELWCVDRRTGGPFVVGVQLWQLLISVSTKYVVIERCTVFSILIRSYQSQINTYYTKQCYDLYGHTESPSGAPPPNPILKFYNAFKTKCYEQ